MICKPRKGEQHAHAENVGTLLFLLVLVALVILSGVCFLPKEELDYQQLHFDTGLALAGHSIRQTFVSHSGPLSAIEFLITDPAIDDGSPGSELTFRLLPVSDLHEELASLHINTAQVDLSNPLRFDLDTPPRVQEAQYVVEIEGASDSTAIIWASSLDVYPGGRLQFDGQVEEGDLYFRTRYRCGWLCLGKALAQEGRELLKIGPVMLVVLLAPGYLAMGLWRRMAGNEPTAWIPIIAGISLAFTSVLWLAGTALGATLAPAGLRWFYGTIVVLTLARLAWSFRAKRVWRQRQKTASDSQWTVLVVFVCLLVAAVRLLQIRNQLLPLWVDSVKHMAIANVLVAEGGVPWSYRPALPIDDFFYHFGYHTVLVTLSALSGWPLERVMLYLGQVLSMLAPFSAYALASRLSRNRVAGLFALVAVGLISTMPSRYITWGRYTLLAGMVLLPVALTLTARILDGEDQTALGYAVTALTWAGLFLTHYRVALFGALFVLAWLLVEGISAWRGGSRFFQHLKRAAILLFLALGMVSPWLYHVATSPRVRVLLAQSFVPARFESPLSVLQQGLGRFAYLFVLKDWLFLGAGVAAVLVAILARRRAAVLGVLWGIGLFVVANPGLFGFHQSWFSDNLSFFATLYLPLTIIVGDILVYVVEMLERRVPQPDRWIARDTLVVGLVGLGIWCSWGVMDVIQPSTVLVTQADREAIRWGEQNLPMQANILVNTRHWAGETFVGTDGGYWIEVLSGRKTTLPSLDYSFSDPPYVEHVNGLASVVAAGTDLATPDVRLMLLKRGVTHIYIGAMGGPLDLAAVAHDPTYELVYSNGPVWIFVDRVAKRALAEAQRTGYAGPLDLLPYKQYVPYLLCFSPQWLHAGKNGVRYPRCGRGGDSLGYASWRRNRSS